MKILIRGNHDKNFLDDKKFDKSLFEEICNYKVIKENGIHYVLFHYPIAEFDGKGYKNQQDGCFSFEDICEISALSNDFVNKVVKEYEFYMRFIETKRIYMEED